MLSGVEPAKNARPSETVVTAALQKYHLQSPYILFVGTIQPRKNLVSLIESFAQLSPQHPELQLVLAGGKGWLSDPIYQAPDRLGIKDKVVFTGYIDEEDKPALYAGARAAALVSYFEGFGLPVLESMACGTPVVAANTSSLPEVVGNAGILVDPNDIQSIANGLNQVLTNESLASKLVENGFQQVQKFSWQNAAAETLKVFEQVAA